MQQTMLDHGKKGGKGRGKKDGKKKEGKKGGKEANRREGERRIISQKIRRGAVSIRSLHRNKTDKIIHTYKIHRFILSYWSMKLRRLVSLKPIGQASRLEKLRQQLLL